MKKPTILRIVLFALIFFQSFISYSQNLKAFTPRFDKDLKGDVLLIGNNILNRDNDKKGERPNNAYNDGKYNHEFDMQYIDIDNNATPGIFSSSSATLTVPNINAPKPACYKIVHAGLYWGAILQSGDRTQINQVKLKLPSGGYNNIIGEVIYDAVNTPIGTDKNMPYACYADVTKLVAGLADPQGTYTMANVISSVGKDINGGTGLSAGWFLYIVYEDPSLPAKSITSFDGFSGISGTTTLDVKVSGFRTIDKGPVRAKFAFAALEGDQPITGDYLEINGKKISATNGANQIIRDENNFFNSSVTFIDPATKKTENFLDRVPKSTNTLGYDAGLIEISNSDKSVIANDARSATIKLGSTGDVYFYYFNALALDIIAPKIVLTKQVLDATGKDIGNTSVVLGQELYYRIGFENIGNDAAKEFTIKDVLPINIIFDPATIKVPNGSGITYTYDKATRTIVFTVPNKLVEVDAPRYEIDFRVQVVPNCNDLSDACSDKIQNQAFAAYKGIESEIVINEDPSLSSFNNCYLGTPSPTNFLVEVDKCKFTKAYELCGADVKISAANGYESYSWSTSPTGTPVIGTTQTITVTKAGTYYVHNRALAPCLSIDQTVTVTAFGTTSKNPVLAFADEIVICSDNKKELPKILLCGANASKFIQTGIVDAKSIVWEKLDEVKCPNTAGLNCPNEKAAANCWNEVARGPDYTANTAGEYRVVLNYEGGCFVTYYFNVYKNSLDPTATSRDIICNTKGEIIVGGVGDGYEYSLTKAGPYQDSKVFVIDTPNIYTVFIKQKGVTTNPCIFEVPGIAIRDREFKIDVKITNPLCKGDLGSVKLAAQNVREQYYYSITKRDGSPVNSVGPIAASNHTFDKLNPGLYTIIVTTDDGCLKSENVEIVEPKVLTATSALTKPLTACSDGQITAYPVGGTAPYTYAINGSTTSQNSAEFPVKTPGTYVINVVDYNGCPTTTTIEVLANPKPVATLTPKNISCYGETNGEIAVTVNPTNSAYTISYSKDNGITFQPSATFSNLAAGDYNIVVKYTLGTVECLDPAQLVTITTPASALTASAGVSELAGCGVNGEGKVRITNPQGGKAPYTYSFDGGVTWVNVKESFLMPGTYTLYVKDALGCVFPMKGITIDEKPLAPTIKVDPPVFNCNGSATSTVTVTNNAGVNYAYEYLMDNVVNPNTANPNVFLNVPAGDHTITVNYKVVSAPTFSNLLKEDFGSGPDVESPGINKTYYCFERQVDNSCNGSNKINDGDHTVTSSILFPHGAWINPVDHTTGTAAKKGRYLAVNIGATIPKSANLYEKDIKDIIHNQPISVELYAINLLIKSNGQFDPDLQLALVDASGGDISSVFTGNIPKTEKWEKYLLTLNPGARSNLKFVIRSNVQRTDGNDVAIDDISVYQLPKSCGVTTAFPITIAGGKAFTASVTASKDLTCAGADNGEITITAQNFNPTYGFDYSMDNGTTWANTKTSPLTVKNLTNKNYAIQVRYDNTAGSCVRPLSKEIIAPTAISITADVKIKATCTSGATIEAIATGGTKPYKYELRDNTGAVIVAFQDSGVFTNVPSGTYTIVAKDTQLCVTSASATVKVDAPTPPTATLSATDACYDTINKATLVVTATGTGTLTYSLNGAPGVTTNTFVVNPGSYTVTVTDSNNCTVTTTNPVVIAPELKATVDSVTELDCDVAPNNEAEINGTITGGIAPFTVTVLSGSAAGTMTYPTATTFKYKTAVAGAYQFEIADAKACKTTATATVNTITNPTVSATPTAVSCFGGGNGSIQLTAAGGSGGYQYTFNKQGATISTYSTTTLYQNLSAGTYNFTVKDSKGCKSGAGSIILDQPTNALAGTIDATEIGCNGNTTTAAIVTVTATAGTGTSPYTYSFNGNTNFTATNTFSTSVATTVTAYIKDKNGCEFGPMSVIIGAKKDITRIDIISDSGLSCPGNTATVTIGAVGGSTPINYQIISGPAGYDATVNTNGVFNNLKPGDYIFKATGKNGCSLTKDYTVSAIPAIKVTGKVTTAIKCFGDKGAIQFTVSGTTRFAYKVVNTANVSVGASTDTNVLTIDINTLPADSYTITVTDKNTNCEATYTLNLTQPTAVLDLSATATTINCRNDEAQVTAKATGGTTNYKYAIAEASTPAPADSAYGTDAVLTVDTNSGAKVNWIVYVKDANGCPDTFPIEIKSDDTPTVTATLDNQCAGSGNAFTITATGTGLAPLSYSIDGIDFKSGNTFTVAPGTYTVTVKDKNGCLNAATAITVSDKLTTTATTKQLDCTTTPDAVITVTIAGGKANYAYEVKNSAGTAVGSATGITGTSFTFSTATADTYTFKITDANSCESTITAKVDAKVSPTVTETAVNPLCDGDLNGSVQLEGHGGSGGFTYSKDGITYSPVSLFKGLGAGTYTFYVKDSKECFGEVEVTLTAPTKLETTVKATTFSCSATNTKQSATVTIEIPTTGTAPYEYSFNGLGFGTNRVLTLNDNVADQPYTFSVKDANGCIFSGSGTLLKLNPPTIDTVIGTPIWCAPTANTTSTVTITVTPLTGVGVLSYVITAPASATTNVTGATNGTFTGLGVGSYTFKITDENGCFTTAYYKVDPVVNISIIGKKISDVKCFGKTEGSLEFTTANYNKTYTHTLKDGSGIITPTEALSNGGKTITYTGLKAGTYTYTVVDDETGCTAASTIVVSEPTELVIVSATPTTVFCSEYKSKITVVASGGTLNYTYAAVIKGASAPTIFGANPVVVDTNNGADLFWDVYVKDANDCPAKLEVEIKEDKNPTVTATVAQCVAGASVFTITATGTGKAPLMYSIDGIKFQTENTFDVVPGSYEITVKDGNGCPAKTPLIVVYHAMTAAAVLTKDLTCADPKAATITVTVGGGKGPYLYQTKIGAGLYTGSIAFTGPTFTYSAVEALGDTYQFLITDSNNCPIETNVIKTHKAVDPTAVENSVNPTCNGSSDGSITLGATGGIAPYEYNFNGAGFVDIHTFGGLTAGTYAYIIRDKKGCEATGSITLTNPAMIAATIKANNIMCASVGPPPTPFTLGSIDVSVASGGTAPYVYKLYNNNSATPIATYTETAAIATPVYSFTGLDFGDYYVTIVDKNGCEFKSAKQRIEAAPYIKLFTEVANATCAAGIDIILEVDGGTGPYTYAIVGKPATIFTTALKTHTFKGLDQKTTYIFVVTDANGCPSYKEITTGKISDVEIIASPVTNVSCHAGATGEIKFKVSKYGAGVTIIDYEIRDQLTNTAIVPAKGGSFTGLTDAVAPAISTTPEATISGLKAGNYTLYVKEVDGTLCSTTLQFQITQPVQALTSKVVTNVNANCNNPAQVTLNTTGGTEPYTYAYAVSPAVPSAFAPGNVLNLDPGISGTDLTWNITVKDANGCTVDLTETIKLDPTPEIALKAVGNCVAEGAFEIEVSQVKAGIAPYTLSVNDGAFVSISGLPYTVTGLNSGVHKIIIQDVNGCTNEQSLTLYKKLSIKAEVTKELDCTGAPDAAITLNVFDGKGPFTYEVSTDAGVTFSAPSAPFAGPSIVVPATTAGTYEFKVKDANKCETKATAIVKVLVKKPTFTFVQTPETCITSNDGTITVTPTAGVAPFEYSINGVYQPGNVFTGLNAATAYTIVIRDAKKCVSDPQDVTIVEPAVVSGTPFLTTPLSCGPANATQQATITVTGTGGAGLVASDYTYSFNGGNFTTANTYTTSVAGLVTVFVKDKNACMSAAITIDVPALNPPKIASITGTAVLCDPVADRKSTVTVTRTAGTGVGVLKYEIISPATAIANITGATSGIFTDLVPDTYVFRVTDANGCTAELDYIVKPVTNITISGDVVNHVSCNTIPASANGAVRFTVANFKGNYSYTVNNIAVAGTHTNPIINLTNLAVGTHTVVVTDNTTNCTATAAVVVNQPTTALSVVPTLVKNANCNFGAKVSVSATGGTATYKYAFALATAPSAPALGDYTATTDAVFNAVLDAKLGLNWIAYVIDANNCPAQAPLTLAIDPLPTIDPITGVCYTGAPVTIKITGTYVGTPTYSIGNGWHTDPNFELKAPATYKLYIKDGNGCIVERDYELKQQLLLDADLTQDLTCDKVASINLLATQGTAPYTKYEVSFNGLAYTTLTAPVSPYTTAIAGTYKFRVTDSQGCTAESKPIVVTPKTKPTFTYTQTNVSCFGDTNGRIIVTPADGLPKYQFSINGAPFQDSNTFSGLAKGTYTIVVKDSKECPSDPIDVIITAPKALAALVTVKPFGCDTNNSAVNAVVSIAVDATTGTAKYSYSFDNGQSFGDSPSITVDTPQTISYVVVDANGCTITGTAKVDAYTPPTAMTIAATPIYCNTAGGFTTVTVTGVTGGVLPFTYEIIEPIGAVVSNTTGVFNNLVANLYKIKVTDFNGCSTVSSIDVKKANAISVSSQLLNDVSCKSGSNGSVAFTVSNYITPANYTYALPGYVPSQVGDVITYTNLPTGKYTFTVTDNTSGCTSQVVDFFIDQPLNDLDFTAVATNINCIDKVATITVTATGGTKEYNYAVVKAGDPAPTAFSTNKVLEVDTNNGAVMNWQVYVQDANGCPVNKPQAIALDPMPAVATAFVVDQCPSLTGTYEIKITASGVGPFEYNVGNGFVTNSTIIVDAPGTYQVTAKDKNGCTSVASPVIVLEVLDFLKVDITALPSCTDNKGAVTAIAKGGSGAANYRYSLDANAEVILGDFNNVAAGPHEIIVRDVITGCTAKYNFKIEEATEIEGLALKGTDVSCKGGSNGTITASLTASSAGVNDNPVYKYALTGFDVLGNPVNVAAQPNRVFENLKAGNYTVTVISGRDCSDTEDIEIKEPELITVIATVNEYGCTSENGANFATVTVNDTDVKGGSTNYTIYEFFRDGVSVQKGKEKVFIEADFKGGDYTVTVFDDKGCMGTSALVKVKPYILLDDKINVTVDAGITCKTREDITVSVTTTGGTPLNLDYTVKGLDGNPYIQNRTTANLTEKFTDLTIGNYSITVKNQDTGCMIKAIHYVNDPNTFKIEATNVTDVTCYGDANGSADLTFVDLQPLPGNEAGIFDYTITGPVPSAGRSTNAGPVNISNLKAGEYSVTATLVNKPECTVTTNFTIYQPLAPLKITEKHTAITCDPGSDGTISVTAEGGWPGVYQFQLLLDGIEKVAYSDQTEFTGLTAGVYTINVKDSKGCVVLATVPLVIPTPITVTINTTTPLLLCNGDKSGVITVAPPTGGQGSNYFYTLNTITATGTISSGPHRFPGVVAFSGLAAGTYSVTVTDGLKCTATSNSVIINEPTEIVSSLVVTKTQTCQTLTKLTLSATGGTGIYTYSANKNFIPVLGSFTTSTTIDVPVGTYHYYVKDANGCVDDVSNDIKIDLLDKLIINLDVTNAKINCAGDNTGVLVATAQGGLGNYVYTLLNQAGVALVPAPVQSVPGYFTGLLAGKYSVGVTSGDCSDKTAVIEIKQPLAPLTITNKFVTNVSCNGANNGKIEILATGGTGEIKYAISPNSNQFESKNVFDKLAPGAYEVIVQDILGCYQIIPFTISEPTAIAANLVRGSIVEEVCAGDKDGEFTITVSGGTAPYSVSIDNINGAYTPGAVGQTQFVFDKLSGGVHIVYIKDAQNCMYELEVIMAESVVIKPNAFVDYACVNNAAANSVTVLVDSSITNPDDVDFSLDGITYQPDNVFRNLAPGTYTVIARHTNGCEQMTAPFDIVSVNPLAIVLSDGGLNEIVATVTGGGGDYQFTLNGEPFGTTNKFIIYKSGDYTVTVTDGNGCTATATRYYEYIDVCVPNYFTPNGDGVSDEWGPGCTINYKNLQYLIFDRYGRQIEKYNLGQKWNGKYKGEELPTGDYWYILKLNDPKDDREFIGHFTLYR